MQSANTTVPRQRSLLPVLAAACLTAYGSIAIVQLSALSDYFLFIAEYAQRSFGLRLIIQFAVTAYLYLLLAMLLYRAVITRVDPSSLPASGIARFVDGISRIVILVSPAFAFRSLLKYAAQSAESPAPIVWLAIV